MGDTHSCVATFSARAVSDRKIYQNLGIGTGTSIHLASWPVVEESFIDKKLEHAVEASRNIVETLLALRKNLNIPVRQPLSAFL